eukprot:gene3191-3760_t
MALPPMHEWSADQAEVDDLRNRVEDIHANHIDSKSVLDMLRVCLGFTSNNIDGNSFSEMDVVTFIKTGVTVEGKLLREHQEIESHDRALQMVYKISKDPTVTLHVYTGFVEKLHRVCTPAPRAGTDDIVPGVLKTKPNLTISQVEGKSIVRYFVEPSETNLQLRELLWWANEHSSTMPILPF